MFERRIFDIHFVDRRNEILNSTLSNLVFLRRILSEQIEVATVQKTWTNVELEFSFRSEFDLFFSFGFVEILGSFCHRSPNFYHHHRPKEKKSVRQAKKNKRNWRKKSLTKNALGKRMSNDINEPRRASTRGRMCWISFSWEVQRRIELEKKRGQRIKEFNKNYS